MIIGAVSENKKSEKRISITPDIAKKYLDNGFNVVIESDLASHLGISDEDFRKVGCQVDSRENVFKKSFQPSGENLIKPIYWPSISFIFFVLKPISVKKPP